MEIGDVVGLVIILMLVAAVVIRGRRRLPRRRDGRQGTSRGPRDLFESGGYERPAPAPPVRAESGGYERTFPRPPERRALRSTLGSRPGLAESRRARQETMARGLGTGSMPTAEEQPRRARRQDTPVSAPPPPRSTGIRRQLTNPQSVRTAFVLREVLDRPVGLGENP